MSFADWETVGEVESWKSGSDFRERLAHVLQHVAELDGCRGIELEPGDSARALGGLRSGGGEAAP